MKSAVGVITAPADVFAQRYNEFYEELASDSTGLSFAFLAAFVDRFVSPRWPNPLISIFLD